jgi:hypothetical protein
VASGKRQAASGKWKVESGKWKVTLATEMHGKHEKHEKHGNCFAWYAWEMSPFGDDCYDKQSARGLASYPASAPSTRA